MSLRLAASGSILALLFPLLAHAIPFGGSVGLILNCYNTAIFAAVGPPRGGSYIWSPATRTYRFGPPRAAGQWLLGLASAPYYCVYSIFPVEVAPGLHIDMMGSSGAPASISLGTALTQGTPPPSASPGGSGTSSGGVGHMIVSEIFPLVDATHGTDPQNEWIEIYNGANTTQNLTNWSIYWGGVTTTIPTMTLQAGAHVILTPSTNLRTFWTIPSTVSVVQISGTGNLEANGAVRLIGPSGSVVDAVSWGSNTMAFTPAAPALSSGRSLSRTTVVTDTNTATDWSANATPSPGD